VFEFSLSNPSGGYNVYLYIHQWNAGSADFTTTSQTVTACGCYYGNRECTNNGDIDEMTNFAALLERLRLLEQSMIMMRLAQL
jgi:hypothetical protein